MLCNYTQETYWLPQKLDCSGIIFATESIPRSDDICSCFPRKNLVQHKSVTAHLNHVLQKQGSELWNGGCLWWSVGSYPRIARIEISDYTVSHRGGHWNNKNVEKCESIKNDLTLRSWHSLSLNCDFFLPLRSKVLCTQSPCASFLLLECLDCNNSVVITYVSLFKQGFEAHEFIETRSCSNLEETWSLLRRGLGNSALFLHSSGFGKKHSKHSQNQGDTPLDDVTIFYLLLLLAPLCFWFRHPLIPSLYKQIRKRRLVCPILEATICWFCSCSHSKRSSVLPDILCVGAWSASFGNGSQGRQRTPSLPRASSWWDSGS